MYFYRLLTLEELKQKQIHNNQNKFNECENTHKYIKGKSYIHLFLNAESCFEDFEREAYDKCYIAKFNIPDEIVCKYGIGLGGYSPIYNAYNKKYRNINARGHFWLPEIAIPVDDFDYSWCEEVCPALDNLGNCYLQNNFITEDNYYREIVYDGYLIGYKDEQELLKKYEDVIKLKKHIIEALTTTKKINIVPKDLNEDSMLAYYSLVNYAFMNDYIKNPHEIKFLTLKNIDPEAINIASKIESDYVIDKQFNSTNSSFCEKLKLLGISISDKMVYDVQNPKVKIITL